MMKRNSFFDNAKVLLIFLVVFGHIIQPFISDSKGMNTLYMWIYTFHMPAFILLSGFFAKGSGNKDYILKLAKRLLVPYLIFQILYTIYYFFIGKEGWQAGIFYPHWSLWFLFSLFCWHILLSWYKKLPALLSISLAVLVGIIVGYFGEIGHTFSLSRTFAFFPFFLIGFWLTEKQVMWVKHRLVKISSVIVMTLLAVAIYYLPDINTGWLLASSSYGDLGMEQYGGIARFLFYIVAAVMTISILAWIPHINLGWVTKLGTRTLYVYLLHGFIVQFFRQNNYFEVNGVIDVLGLAAISALIVIVLSSKPVLRLWQPFIEGKVTLLKQTIKGERNRSTTQTES